ncbi:MAG: glycosyltransferase [Parvularcula sp.]|jgi:GT2 family glycosyltransferase|nr:glycosyltransferase [Parvularcula sp.]
MTSIGIVVPVLNEAANLEALRRNIEGLYPPPDKVLVIDGGSLDGTAEKARTLGFEVESTEKPGRGRQINKGVEAVGTDLVLVLHADTILPPDALAVVGEVLSDRRTALGGFTALLTGPLTTRWATSFHNWLKTWYAPLLFRPHLFLKGCRLLFGDHAMFFRRTDFLAVGGCEEEMMVMEDADLSVKLTEKGRVRLINRVVQTSDRRVAAWGELKANWIYLHVGIRWGLGLRKRLGKSYPDIR